MIELVTTLALIVIGFFFGNYFEKRHYAHLIERERDLMNLPASVGRPKNLQATEVTLVNGSVVIASDYFKQFIASLKNFFGGRLSSHESLLDRARREAMLRMKTQAHVWGAREVVNVKLSTSFIDSIGIEVTATGTAIK